MSGSTPEPTESLRWRDRVAIAENELTVVLIILAGILDRRTADETDWQRLVVALHRLRAVREEP